ncbi:unnamed protein product [Macrosiphum euphorbiae]|uniref:Uncharacterized protein n=1 Tax=Macrosiphum euphorbiae TaxID=13131 RepID=A0AAV0YAL6_9HEMI|nr:unnamed protein product [Macrosiphum euphorbiae]
MTELKNNALPGGWENTFEETIIVENIEEGIQYKLNGIELFKRIINDQRRKIHHLYVSDYRRFEAIRNDTLESMLHIQHLHCILNVYINNNNHKYHITIGGDCPSVISK